MNGHKVDKKKLVNLIKNTYHFDFEFNYFNLILNFFGLKVSNKIMCSEYISFILSNLNIINNNNHHSCLPCYFEKKIKTNNNYYYNEIEYFK